MVKLRRAKGVGAKHRGPSGKWELLYINESQSRLQDKAQTLRDDGVIKRYRVVFDSGYYNLWIKR